MKFRPCIDLHQSKVKQIVGSTLSDADDAGLITNFQSDRPSSFYARLYRDDELAGGHVIMLGPGNQDAALGAIREFPKGLQVGGGINPDNAAGFLDAGASHVIVTSFVFNDGKVDQTRLASMIKCVGKSRLVIDLSCRKKNDDYLITTDRWQKFTSVAICQTTLQDLARSCDEFLVHAADVEGKQQGIDEQLVSLLGSASPIPVTYAGGIRSLEDLQRIADLGGNRVDFTIGSALDIFGGTLKYREVVDWCKDHTGTIHNAF
jgi:phosphoribosylformimino-5-aminoimidazole carboxamide ribotide isomerase